MTIPINSIVDVSITIGASIAGRRGFGILNCVTAETGVIGFTERIRSYASAAEVAADWPSTSEVVALANSYFAQAPKPTTLKVSVRAQSAVAAELRGGAVADTPENLALFTAVSDGEFAISIDGSANDISGLDFSTDTDLIEVAAAIEAAVQLIGTGGYTAATVTHSNGRFTITSGTTGVSSLISFLSTVAAPAGTDVSSILQGRQGEANKINGFAAETITDALDAIEAAATDWYGLIFTKEVRDAAVVNTENAVVAAAAWVQARIKVFFNTSNDLDVLNSSVTDDIVSVLNDSSSNRTMSTFSSYPDQYPSASIAGRAFTVDFAQPNSTITLKFKQTPGITAESLNTSQKLVLDSKRGNAVFNIGPSGAIFGESYMAGTLFFDEVHGTDWLADAIQSEVFNYLAGRATKVPYTDAGVAALEQQVIKVLNEAVASGLVSTGTTVDGDFLPNGFRTTTVPVASVPLADQGNRQYNGLSFTALGAGAIHGVQIQGVFER